MFTWQTAAQANSLSDFKIERRGLWCYVEFCLPAEKSVYLVEVYLLTYLFNYDNLCVRTTSVFCSYIKKKSLPKAQSIPVELCKIICIQVNKKHTGHSVLNTFKQTATLFSLVVSVQAVCAHAKRTQLYVGVAEFCITPVWIGCRLPKPDTVCVEEVLFCEFSVRFVWLSTQLIGLKEYEMIRAWPEVGGHRLFYQIVNKSRSCLERRKSTFQSNSSER